MPDTVATPDQVSLGVVMTAVPRDVIDAAITNHGAGRQRSDGKLPPHVVAYATLGLCLFSDDDYSEVLTKVTGTLTAFGCWASDWTVPTPSALTQARKRLGPDVAQTVFEAVAGPVADLRTKGAWLGNPHHTSLAPQRRLVAIDGFDVDVPDTPANAAEFGYAGGGNNSSGNSGSGNSGNSGTGGGVTRSAYPKARVVVLAECGTHAVLAAQVAPYNIGEKTLAARLYPQLAGDEVLLADRGFYSYPAWGQAQTAGAQLIWRAPTQLTLYHHQTLPDGSYLAFILSPDLRGKKRAAALTAARAAHPAAITRDPGTENTGLENTGLENTGLENTGLQVEGAHLVRVVDYDIPDRDGNGSGSGSGSGELITLLTTLLDPDDVTAEELAAAYHQRWEEESTFDELKTHLRGPGRVLRSRLPDLANQEIWAWLTLHHALAALRAAAAQAAAIDPDRISYVRLLRIVRRTATGTADFPP